MKSEEKLMREISPRVRYINNHCRFTCAFIKAGIFCDLFNGDIAIDERGKPERREVCKKIFCGHTEKR